MEESTLDRYRAQIEREVRRPLSAEELVLARSISDLNPAQQAVLQQLALDHRLVATLYLCGVVDGLIPPEAILIIDAIRDKAGV